MASGTCGCHAEGRGAGMVLFASILLLVIGFFNMLIPAYPFWALVIIAADVVALWGLCAYGSRENLEAV